MKNSRLGDSKGVFHQNEVTSTVEWFLSSLLLAQQQHTSLNVMYLFPFAPSCNEVISCKTFDDHVDTFDDFNNYVQHKLDPLL